MRDKGFPNWISSIRRSVCLCGLVLGNCLLGSRSQAELLGDVTDFSTQGNIVTVACGTARIRVEAWADDVIRIWLSPDGSFGYYNANNSFLIQPGMRRFTGASRLDVGDAGAYIRIRTPRLTLRVLKSPFGFALYQADNATLITATAPGQALDTTVKLFLKRDACGQAEHYFGLQFEDGPVTTLDRRGDSIGLKDANGYGWPAPFMMSSAGYGLFFHNEDDVNTRFSLTDPVVVENTATNGQADFFFFYGPDFKHILDLYTDLTGKPPMPPKKLMGFQYLVQGTPMTNAEAFPDWIARDYPIDSCITFTDAGIEATNEIANVQAAARQIHELHGLFGFYFDFVGHPGTFRISQPVPPAAPYTNWIPLMTLIKTRLLDNGVDWFWIDETEYVAARGRYNFYQALIQTMEAQDSRRGFVCARGGYAGCQQFGYPWMGDKAYNRETVLANLCNGLVGVPHSTHDMAGAGVASKTEIAFLAGVKASFLNPFSQCNNWIPTAWGEWRTHRPWEWSAQAQTVFRKFDELHYQLIPYFYNTAWQAHTTGLPVWRALLLEYPGETNYYSSDEILVGDWLLMAPLYSDGGRTVMLPPGKWTHFFTGSEYDGPCSLTNFSCPVDQYPLFVKAGAILPLMPSMRYVGERPADPLCLMIYPAGYSSTTFYEDDGVTRNYLNGEYCTTQVECLQGRTGMRVTINARQGTYVPASRSLMLKMQTARQPQSVKRDGLLLTNCATTAELAGFTRGWCFASNTLTGTVEVQIKLPDTGDTQIVDITCPQGWAAYRGQDSMTGGDWYGRYGFLGQAMVGSGTNLPADVDISIGGTPYLWTEHTTSSNALQNLGQTNRLAACAYGDQLAIDVNITGNESKWIALYFLDWDGANDRVVRIEASNPGTGEIFDTRSISNFNGGRYLRYAVKGGVRFNLARVSGANAVVSAVFLDPGATEFQEWQLTYFGSTNSADGLPEADPDGDGSCNQQEYQSGTNPTNSLSAFRITDIRPEGTGFRVFARVPGGRLAVLQATTNLTARDFVDVAAPIVLPSAENCATNFFDAGALTRPCATFYRIRSEPLP